jgi:hypothetical protein
VAKTKTEQIKMMQSIQVIIERLKSNPEDFFGEISDRQGLGLPRPKFYDITDKIDNLLTEPQDGHVHRLWYLEPEEKEALLAAYKEARRSRFEAKVFHTLLTAQEPDPQYDINMDRMSPSGKRLMQGTTSNIIAPQSMLAEANKLIRSEFDKQYAKNSNP